MKNLTDVWVLKIFTTLIKNITVFIGLLGAIRALLSKKYIWPAIIFFCYFLSAFAFVPTSRYALQYYPLLAIFAGYVIDIVFCETSDSRFFSKKRNSTSEK